MERSYELACKEAVAVLDRVPSSQLSQIPNNILNHLKKIAKKSKKNINLSFDIYGNPIISDDAKSILVLIYQKYFLDDSARQALTNKLYENDKK